MSASHANVRQRRSFVYGAETAYLQAETEVGDRRVTSELREVSIDHQLGYAAEVTVILTSLQRSQSAINLVRAQTSQNARDLVSSDVTIGSLRMEHRTKRQ